MWPSVRRNVLHTKVDEMRYFVFEAGSRCGFSAEQFFINYQKAVGHNDDSLYLVDSDPTFSAVETKLDNIYRISETDAYHILSNDSSDVMIFPADELTRQSKEMIRMIASYNPMSKVDKLYYNKRDVNLILSGNPSPIIVPYTFKMNGIVVKPNSMSAGSKGIQYFDDVCVSKKIDIQQEFVVDIYCDDLVLAMYGREVKLRTGYDKMIRFLDDDDPIYDAVESFVRYARETPIGNMFNGIFHIQLAKNRNGSLFFIEASKRLSGTSIVNIVRGFNPFCFINIVPPTPQSKKKYTATFETNKWYRYEDILLSIHEYV